MSNNIKPFDPLTIAIRGTNLIEASAGTGKTWSIAALFLRLILLEKIEVAQILVVTYTKAATSELKTRLRARLAEALSFAQDNNTPLADDYLIRLFKKIDYPQHEQILRLQAALNHFDKATIYTIHGFCQRVLQEYAFACGTPFEVELVSENDKALRMLTEDFWREYIVHNALWSKLIFDHKLTPQNTLGQIKTTLSKPYLVYEQPQSTLESAKKQLNTAWENFSDEKINELITQFWIIHPRLNGNKYRLTTYEALFKNLVSIAHSQDIDALNQLKFDVVAKLTPPTLLEATKKNQTISEAELAPFYFIESLVAALENRKQAEENELAIIKFTLYTFLNDSLQKYNRRYQQRRFDDLLLDLYQALEQSEQGEILANAVAQKWQVALIDEFQDTDPIQYHIFKNIFIKQRKPLFLVGDPKQAIYRFRGADIFAYLQAAQQAEYSYTLNTNFRTHQALLQSIGQIFQQNQQPFLFKQITYSDVQANRLENHVTPCEHSFNIQWLEDQHYPTQMLNKDVARELAAQTCANSIANQLTLAQEGTLKYKEKPLQAKNIAVLVSTHNQGRLIRDKLKDLNIDSVSLSQESVFASREAKALLILLNAWIKPNSANNIIALMASIFCQYTAKQLYDLRQNDSALLKIIQDMQNSQDVWQKRGILSAYQQFNQHYHITEQLLNRAQERSLTNITQLLELLSAEEGKKFSIHSQINWLTEQINAALEGKKVESAQLRLESDENLVKIITIHSAKGLQYPVVYCPFIWDSHKFTLPEIVSVHKNNQNYLYSAHQLSSQDKQLIQDEELAEKLRLLYVALTRAQDQLFITLGNINGIEQTAISYLLVAQEDLIDREETVAKLIKKMSQLMQKNPTIYVNKEIETGHIFQSTKTVSQQFKARQFSEKIGYGKSISSFSGLSSFTRQVIDDENLPKQLDRSENTPQEYEPKELFNSFTLPKGNKTGLCLHGILEQFNFQKPATKQLEIIDAALESYHIDLIWQDTVANMLDDTLYSLLNDDFRLTQCPPKKQLRELGFTFNAHQFSTSRLHKTLSNPILNLPETLIHASKRLDFPTLEGFCNGFIDLIAQDEQENIYVIDYKSNYLGEQLENYTDETLINAIAEHHYYLQAMLYAVATYRYFRQRQRPLNAIHIRYQFLRGLQKDQDCGVWKWDLTEEMIQLLDSSLT